MHNGQWYFGSQNTSADGLKCLKWDTQHPVIRDPEIPMELFPEMLNAENFCRNPGGLKKKPWCYTSDPKIEWQYCDIPVCGELLHY